MTTRSLTAAQEYGLVLLRWLIGWHLLYEGLAKLLNPYWTSAGYLSVSTGPLSGWYVWLASAAGRLRVVDLLNEWGLVLIGLGLLLGLFTRYTTLAGILLLALYYLGNVPLLGDSPIPTEGSYLLVNKTLIEMMALIVVLSFPSAWRIGLDGILGIGRRNR